MNEYDEISKYEIISSQNLSTFFQRTSLIVTGLNSINNLLIPFKSYRYEYLYSFHSYILLPFEQFNF
jgi:hypothetical protein